MLLEPGPLPLFTEAEIPQPGAYWTLTAGSWEGWSALEGTQWQLGEQLSVMAAGGTNELAARPRAGSRRGRE